MIRTEVVPDDRAFVAHVQASKPKAAGDWQDIFDDLDHAMDAIEAKVTDHATWRFLIRLRVEGFDTERFFGSEEGWGTQVHLVRSMGWLQSGFLAVGPGRARVTAEGRKVGFTICEDTEMRRKG